MQKLTAYLVLSISQVAEVYDNKNKKDDVLQLNWTSYLYKGNYYTLMQVQKSELFKEGRNSELVAR